MTDDNDVSTNGNDREVSIGKETRPRVSLLVAIVLVGFGALILVAVDVFPIITNDSVAYLRHSDDLVSTGLVQIGYRQIGYPMFLASVDAVASLARIEPLVVTAVFQRLFFLSAVVFGVWLWRWRAIPLVILAIVPSLVVYANFILTEGIAIGLVAWYAVLVSLAVRLGASFWSGKSTYSGSALPAVGILASTAYVMLAVIRFQYALLVIGVLGVWYVMYRAGGRARVTSFFTSLSVVLILALFFGAVTLENGRELGAYSPSVRGERSRFWATWQVTFTLSPENQSKGALEDLYGDGNPYSIMSPIDSLPDYSDQQDAYSEALEALIDGSGTTWTKERVKSAIGVLRGGRFDDLQVTAWRASRAQPDEIERWMYRSKIFRPDGVEEFVDRYNKGKAIEPLVLSPLAPLRSLPYFVSILRWELLVAMGVLILGLFNRRSRLLALLGILTLVSTAAIFGYLLMDNVRFILIPLLFVVTTATGVGDILWRTWRRRNVERVSDAVVIERSDA